MGSTTTTSADYWQKSPQQQQSQQPADLHAYYWSSANPYYGPHGAPPQTGGPPRPGTAPSGPATISNGSAIKRNPFPLTLPLYQNLPRARLREEANAPSPNGTISTPTMTPRARLIIREEVTSSANGGTATTPNGTSGVVSPPPRGASLGSPTFSRTALNNNGNTLNSPSLARPPLSSQSFNRAAAMNGNPPPLSSASFKVGSATMMGSPSFNRGQSNSNNNNGSNNNNVGYKLATNGGGSPPTLHNPFGEKKSPFARPPITTVWTVDQDRQQQQPQAQPVVLEREPSRRKTVTNEQPAPQTAIQKYGDKRGSPPRGSSGSMSTREKQPKMNRFLQTLCCCISPQRETEKPPLPSNVQSTKNGSGHSQSTPTSSPITQIQRGGSSKASNLNNESIPAGSNPITQISQDGVNNGVVVINDCIPYPTPDIVPQNVYKAPLEKLLLPAVKQQDVNRKCLIIDLDETLVHSSFKPVKNPDFVIPVEIDGVVHQVYVLKRPYVDEFLARVGEKFECVLFTASLAKYADPVADLLDKRGVFRSRLFREACVFHKGNYIKDLARLGRDLNRTIIVDNSPTSYAFHPENAIPVQTWFDDPSDVELLDILPLLDRLAQVDSVYSVLRNSNTSPDSAALLDRPYP